MDSGDVIVVLVVAAALSFDFTNGFHDTANAMATTIATGALAPRVAGGIVDAGAITPTVVFGGLIGAICWNLTTWWFGLPSSSSHALIGGIIGATLAAAVAALVYGVIDVLGGGEAGVIVVAVAAALAAAALWRANRAKPVEPEETVSEDPAFGAAARPELVAA